jgi:prevent-host-death family protein
MAASLYSELDDLRNTAIIDLVVVILHVRAMDMIKKVSALKTRKNLGQLLEEVYYRGDQYIIERAGRPMAAVVPVWQLQQWQKRRERFFGMVDELRKKNKRVKPDVIEREVAEAVQAVRAKGTGRKV